MDIDSEISQLHSFSSLLNYDRPSSSPHTTLDHPSPSPHTSRDHPDNSKRQMEADIFTLLLSQLRQCHTQRVTTLEHKVWNMRKKLEKVAKMVKERGKLVLYYRHECKSLQEQNEQLRYHLRDICRDQNPRISLSKTRLLLDTVPPPSPAEKKPCVPERNLFGDCNSSREILKQPDADIVEEHWQEEKSKAPNRLQRKRKKKVRYCEVVSSTSQSGPSQRCGTKQEDVIEDQNTERTNGNSEKEYVENLDNGEEDDNLVVVPETCDPDLFHSGDEDDITRDERKVNVSDRALLYEKRDHQDTSARISPTKSSDGNTKELKGILVSCENIKERVCSVANKENEKHQGFSQRRRSRVSELETDNNKKEMTKPKAASTPVEKMKSKMKVNSTLSIDLTYLSPSASPIKEMTKAASSDWGAATPASYSTNLSVDFSSTQLPSPTFVGVKVTPRQDAFHFGENIPASPPGKDTSHGGQSSFGGPGEPRENKSLVSRAYDDSSMESEASFLLLQQKFSQNKTRQSQKEEQNLEGKEKPQERSSERNIRHMLMQDFGGGGTCMLSDCEVNRSKGEAFHSKASMGSKKRKLSFRNVAKDAVKQRKIDGRARSVEREHKSRSIEVSPYNKNQPKQKFKQITLTQNLDFLHGGQSLAGTSLDEFELEDEVQEADKAQDFKVPDLPVVKKRGREGTYDGVELEDVDKLIEEMGEEASMIEGGHVENPLESLNGSVDPIVDLTTLCNEENKQYSLRGEDGVSKKIPVEEERGKEKWISPTRGEVPCTDASVSKNYGPNASADSSRGGNRSDVDMFEESWEDGGEKVYLGIKRIDGGDEDDDIRKLVQNFDMVPKKNDRPGFKHIEVVRKHSERAKLKGFGCKQCEEFYATMGLTDSQLVDRMNACSRHRAKHSPSNTPEHYWSIDFPDTPTCIKRGYIQQTISSTPEAEPRPRRKNRLKQLFPKKD